MVALQRRCGELDLAMTTSNCNITMEGGEGSRTGGHLDLDGDEEAALWDEDGEHGFVRVDYDPATQTRVRVVANSRAAALAGAAGGREELLARYARREVALPMPPLDAVCLFLDSLRRAHDDGAVRYYRVMVGPPPGVGALACVRTAKVFNNRCQLRQVFRFRRLPRTAAIPSNEPFHCTC
jgi:hypothetical protein